MEMPKSGFLVTWLIYISDKNECSNGEALCHPLLATCTNTPGAYTCACITGYQGDGMTCNGKILSLFLENCSKS